MPPCLSATDSSSSWEGAAPLNITDFSWTMLRMPPPGALLIVQRLSSTEVQAGLNLGNESPNCFSWTHWRRLRHLVNAVNALNDVAELSKTRPSLLCAAACPSDLC